VATQEELTAYKLRKRVHELEDENARYLKNQNIARKTSFGSLERSCLSSA